MYECITFAIDYIHLGEIYNCLGYNYCMIRTINLEHYEIRICLSFTWYVLRYSSSRNYEHTKNTLGVHSTRDGIPLLLVWYVPQHFEGVLSLSQQQAVSHLPMLTSTPRTRFAPTMGIGSTSPREGDVAVTGVDPPLLPALLFEGDDPLDVDIGMEVDIAAVA